MEPVAKLIQGQVANLFFGYQHKKDFGKPYGANVMSCRINAVFKRMVGRQELPARLEKLANGVNKARHASISEDRANEGSLSAAEIADQHWRRGQNPPVQPASEHYGQNAQGGSPGHGQDNGNA